MPGAPPGPHPPTPAPTPRTLSQYLRATLVKFFENGSLPRDGPAMPVVSRLLRFTPSELAAIQAAAARRSAAGPVGTLAAGFAAGTGGGGAAAAGGGAGSGSGGAASSGLLASMTSAMSNAVSGLAHAAGAGGGHGQGQPGSPARPVIAGGVGGALAVAAAAQQARYGQPRPGGASASGASPL